MIVYVGLKYLQTLQGTTWKPVCCGHCGAQWAYKVARTAQGTGRSPYYLNNDGAQMRARYEAQENLRDELTMAVGIVACPRCGYYQAAMVQLLRSYQRPYLAMLAWTLVSIGAFFTAITILMAVHFDAFDTFGTVFKLWPMHLLGLGPLATGCWLVRKVRRDRLAYDPNADMQTRQGRIPSIENGVCSREQYEEVVIAAMAR
jgi:hypothetical protein